MRQLYYQMVSRGYVPNTTRDNCHKRTSGKALCGASDKCLTPSGGGPGAAPPHLVCSRADDSGWCGAGTFSGAPGELPGRRPDQALRDRPVGLVRSLLQIRQTLGPGDVDVEVLDVDVDLVRRRGQRLSSPDCPG